jgi:hypothetical protein
MQGSEGSNKYQIRQLAAFWQHFTLHRRTCDKTGESMVSVFSPDCLYPVWKRSTWLEDTLRPEATYAADKSFFEQLYALFSQCPIPHITGGNNENCDYCDDWWNSKDCYLCHSGLECQDDLYCYRTLACKDSRYAVFSFHSELCNEVLDAHRCFHVICGLHIRQCSESAFLFDCRNCSNCFLCWNLRNKEYCIENVQYSKDEYRAIVERYDLRSHRVYHQLKKRFCELLETQALWRGVEVERCEDATGAFIEGLKNSERCFFISDSEDCTDCVRAVYLKNCTTTVGCWNGELIRNSVLIGDTRTYDVAYSYQCMDCYHIEYCAFCLRSKNCFACCGLVGAEYCILNKQYTAESYAVELARIKESLLREGSEYGDFFPPHFSPSAYDESLSGHHFPLTHAEQQRLGFVVKAEESTPLSHAISTSELPDSVREITPQWIGRPLIDLEAQKRFALTPHDITLCQKLGVPLPTRYYHSVIKELFSYLSYDGELHTRACFHCDGKFQSHFTEVQHPRVLCDDCYRQL